MNFDILESPRFLAVFVFKYDDASGRFCRFASYRKRYQNTKLLLGRFCANRCMIEVNTMENGNQPATKQDIAEVRTEMKAMEDRLIEAFRDSQTELLKAFYSFTESNRQRVSQLEGNQSSLITRVGALEDRMTDLQLRTITPPRTQ